MSLCQTDLQELYRRAQLAFNSGYTVARGDDYAALLGGSDGSPAGLIELCEKALPTPGEEAEDSAAPAPTLPETTEEAKAEEPAPPPEPAAAEPAAEVAPISAPADSTPVEGAPVLDAPLDQILDEVATEETPSDGPEYEGWSRKQLLVEAEAKGVEVKSSMSKGDIIAALRASAAG